MLDRKDFLKKCALAMCAPGLCATTAEASDAKACDPKQLEAASRKINDAQVRFARLIEQIEHGLPEEDGKRLLNAMGRQCATMYRPDLIDRFKGDIHGFLQQGLRIWMAEAHYDEAAGTLRIVDKPNCTCPLAKQGTTPGKFCECSLGWQEEAYSVILGRPVEAELEESILRGGKRCVFRMTVG